jgi:hypothetical protein
MKSIIYSQLLPFGELPLGNILGNILRTKKFVCAARAHSAG